MSKKDREVSAKEEVKMETPSVKDVYRVEVRVNMEVQVRKVNEKDSCCSLVHGLRVMQAYTVG